jgi:hypothetical protein
MSNHPTSKDLPSVISSPESEDGAEHLSLQDGAQSDLFGQEAHRANLFQQQGTTLAKTMNDISGLSSSISSASAALQQSLESRLRQQLDLDGLTIYKLTLEAEDYAAAAVVLPSGGIGARTKENAVLRGRLPQSGTTRTRAI